MNHLPSNSALVLPPVVPNPPAGTAEFLGDAYPTVAKFAELLCAQGQLRGLIGPKEIPNLWERHLLNCAAVVRYLPLTGQLIDLGSGGGLPGIVIAAMRPEQGITLIESMLRRTTWLNEVATELELANVTIIRGRAEDLGDKVKGVAVTARAVAPLGKLLTWARPLLLPGGELVALKGANAPNEIPSPAELARNGWAAAQIIQAQPLPTVAPTTVVQVRRAT